MTTDPTPATLLAEALGPGVLMRATSKDVIQTNTPGLSVDGALMRQRLVEGLLAHDPLRDALTRGLALTPDRLAAALEKLHSAAMSGRTGHDETCTAADCYALAALAMRHALTPEAPDAAE